MTDSLKDGNSAGGYHPLKVNLPIFDGPLDLLLHLVRKQSLDINDLKVSELTEPYLAYLEQMQDLNLDQGGEFLTIAATLIWIKSKSLLPRNMQNDELDAETMEEMLVMRLQEYQKIKDAAHELRSLDLLGREVFPRGKQDEEESPSDQNPVFADVSLFGLLEAFRNVLERSQFEEILHLVPDKVKVEEKLVDMLTLLAKQKSLLFNDFFLENSSRGDIILAFLALLELVRLKAVRIVQANPGGQILCEATEYFTESGLDWEKKILGSLFGTQEEENQTVTPLS